MCSGGRVEDRGGVGGGGDYGDGAGGEGRAGGEGGAGDGGVSVGGGGVGGGGDEGPSTLRVEKVGTSRLAMVITLRLPHPVQKLTKILCRSQEHANL